MLSTPKTHSNSSARRTREKLHVDAGMQNAKWYTPAEAKRVAGTLLPDVMPYDPTRPASFPDNGRTLTDDAFDWFMRVLTNGRVAGDSVGPHGDLLRKFPYVGPPHQSRVTKAPMKTKW